MANIVSNLWLQKRRPYWNRLEVLLAAADAGGVKQLSRAEMREMALLYRQVAADLSVLRRDTTAQTYAAHVNQLLARAHHIIYAGRKTRVLALFKYLRDEYPVVFRRNLGYVAASVGITVASGVLGAILTSTHIEFMRHFVGPEMVATMERHEMWTHSVVSVAPMATSAIMTNNLTVSFLMFAGGIIFGLYTLLLLYFNGMLLGVIGAACHHYGMSVALWSFVAPHGSLELPAILIAGAAGLRLGKAMVFPGGLRWKDSVAQGGIEASKLLSGTIPMLVVAGCLEGFFSPSAAPVALKFAVGGLLFCFLNAWLFGAGKEAAATNSTN
ncbi:MAG TPA: stage II sporulation protein M [Terracidiphilus sp.]|jgi:uncharacterized membrane protein SpoIIM required for sporulation